MPSIVLVLAVVISYCGGGNDGPTGSGATTGSITLTAATTGDAADTDGYDVVLADSIIEFDGPIGHFEVVGDSVVGHVGASGSVTVDGVAPGSYTILLAGLAPGCHVTGDPPVTVPGATMRVNVLAGESAAVQYALECEDLPLNAGLDLAISTTGINIDPDGYSLSFDFGDAHPVGANGTFSYPDLATGSLLFWLRGVAANCSVNGGDLQAVDDLEPGVIRSMQLVVECEGAP
jgi:hypothetical protein